MSGSEIPVQSAPLHYPALAEVATVLQGGLSKNFNEVEVSVVDCPDLREKPFMLANEGLGGSPRVVDVGGVPYLHPTVQKDKVYNMEEVAKLMDLPGAFIIGAGAGPHHVVGANSEMMPNLTAGTKGSACVNKSHICKVNPEDGGYKLQKVDSTDMCLLANLYLCEGKPCKVMEVKAKHRTGPENFMTCMRKTLAAHYGDKPVAVGGVFIVEKGKIKTHVMPDFSKTPTDTDEKVSDWLKYYEMSSPLVCLGYLISHDPDLDLRVEHFHGFSAHGDGGHYHYDTTPAEVEYRGYLTVAEYIFRVDRPKETHQIGRD